MKVAIIIVEFNTRDILKNCLESIYKYKWQNQFEVLVVDNASTDDSVEMVKKNFPKVKVISSSKNLGFGGGNNLGLKSSDGDYYLLLNSDTIVLDNSLDNLVEFAKTHDYGLSSCKLLNADKTLQPNVGDLPIGLALFNWLSGLDDLLSKFGFNLSSFHQRSSAFYKKSRQVGWVQGAAMLIRKDVFEKIGGLDEGIFMYAEDVEYCMRAQKAKFKIGFTNKAEIIHLGGASSSDPSLKQWSGEFIGLIYIYKKYFSSLAQLILKVLLYIFIIMRIIIFLALGKFKIASTYAKIISTL